MWGRIFSQTLLHLATPWYSSELELLPEHRSDTLQWLVLARFLTSGGWESLRFMFCYSKGTANTLEREVYQTSNLGFEPEDTKGRSQKLSLQKHSLVKWNHHSTGHILLIRKPRLVISSTVPTEGSSRTVDGIEEALPGCSVCSRQKSSRGNMATLSCQPTPETVLSFIIYSKQTYIPPSLEKMQWREKSWPMMRSLSWEHKGALSGGSGGDSLRPFCLACVLAHEQLIAKGQKLHDLLWISVTPVDILDGQQTEI